MKRIDCDAVIIGAGVAGLAAAIRLSRAGKHVRCLEATDRAGGRIRTVHDPLAPLPIELGAEFVHGRPPEIWELIQAAGLTAYEHTSLALYFDHGRILNNKRVSGIGDGMISELPKSISRKDESFEDYIELVPLFPYSVPSDARGVRVQT